jgi:hypothetical protein
MHINRVVLLRVWCHTIGQVSGLQAVQAAAMWLACFMCNITGIVESVGWCKYSCEWPTAVLLAAVL